MKYTLLDIVTDILSDLESDPVNSINDTEEGLQVAQIVKTTFQAMMSNRNWPHTAQVVTITPFSDNEHPTHMRVNDEIKSMISLYYDCRRNDDPRLNYRQIKYIDPDAFLRLTNQRNSTDPNTKLVIDPSGVKLLITTNKPPEYYTSFNDSDMVFDSYDKAVDSTLQSNKFQARAYRFPKFEMIDTHVPDLPEDAFAALIEESKSKAFLRLKSVQDVKAEQESNRQQRFLSRNAWKVHSSDIYPYSYGRKNAKGIRKDPTFRRV